MAGQQASWTLRPLTSDLRKFLSHQIPSARPIVVSFAMDAVYVASIQSANAKWKGKWKGCFGDLRI
jgi:hypothetical protein